MKIFIKLLLLLLLFSCKEKVEVVFETIQTSEGVLNIANLEKRVDSEGEVQCANYYNYGTNEDSTLFYCYGCTVKEVVRLFKTRDFYEFENATSWGNKSYWNVEFKPNSKSFSLNNISKKVTSYLNIKLEYSLIDVEGLQLEKGDVKGLKYVENSDAQISIKGDDLSVEEKSLRSISNAFRWISKVHIKTTDSSTDIYSFNMKVPKDIKETKLKLAELGFKVTDIKLKIPKVLARGGK